MPRRTFVGVLALVSAFAATQSPVLGETGPGGGGPGGTQLQPCQQGQQPTQASPCIPQGGFPGGGGSPGGQPGGFPGGQGGPGGFPGKPQPCAEGQIPSPQSPCIPPQCQE